MLGLFAATTEPTIESIESADYVNEEVIEVEDWMTRSFQDSVEEPLEIEDWMTKPFITTKNEQHVQYSKKNNRKRR